MIRVGIIGCGNFATGMHLPNFQRLAHLYELRWAADVDGERARQAAHQFGIAYATNDYQQVLADPDVDLVVITTRHDLHARLIMEAAEAGKHVLVEKPMAMTEAETAAVKAAVRRTGVTFAIGFNRRFSPLALTLRQALAERPQPWMIHYRMVDEIWQGWPLDPKQGGGRILSETCHVFDFLCWLTGSEPVRLYAAGGALTHPGMDTQDNAVITLEFASGSIASIVHGDLGSSGYPKERIEVFGGRFTGVIDNFQSLTMVGEEAPTGVWNLPAVDKGHLAELEALAEAIGGGRRCEIDEVAGARSTILALRAIESLRTHRMMALKREDWQ